MVVLVVFDFDCHPVTKWSAGAMVILLLYLFQYFVLFLSLRHSFFVKWRPLQLSEHGDKNFFYQTTDNSVPNVMSNVMNHKWLLKCGSSKFCSVSHRFWNPSEIPGVGGAEPPHSLESVAPPPTTRFLRLWLWLSMSMTTASQSVVPIAIE